MPTANEEAAQGLLSSEVPAGALEADLEAAIGMLTDSGYIDMEDEMGAANALLDAAGAPVRDFLDERILAVAEIWLSRVAGDHSDGCLCHQCHASRRIVSRARTL